MLKTRNIISLALLLAFAATANAQEAKSSAVLMGNSPAAALAANDKNGKIVILTDNGHADVSADGSFTLFDGATPQEVVRALLEAVFSAMNIKDANAKAAHKEELACQNELDRALGEYTVLRVGLLKLIRSTEFTHDDKK